MSVNPRLRKKIRSEIQHWLDTRGADFILYIKEFCQGNRAALTKVLGFVEELGIVVFAGDGDYLDKDLLEKLEYGMFDLIARFNSTPGGPRLEDAIRENIAQYLVEIFAEAKSQWNLNQYKMAASYEELDPGNCLIAASATGSNDDCLDVRDKKEARQEARLFLDELAVFASAKLRGEKNRQIAVSWLENPERIRDYGWLASLTNSSVGSIKVTLTRLKHTLCRNYRLQYVDNRLEMNRVDMLAGSNPS